MAKTLALGNTGTRRLEQKPLQTGKTQRLKPVPEAAEAAAAAAVLNEEWRADEEQKREQQQLCGFKLSSTQSRLRLARAVSMTERSHGFISLTSSICTVSE